MNEGQLSIQQILPYTPPQWTPAAQWFQLTQKKASASDATSVVTGHPTMHEETRAAFSTFLLAKQDQLLGIATRMLRSRDDAMDVLQEVACLLYKHWHSLDESNNVDGWLYRVTVNECHRWLRKRSKYQLTEEPTDLPGLPNQQPQQEGYVRAQQFQRFLHGAMEILSEQERIAFVLRDIEQQPGKSIATLMECQPATARGYYFSARKKLAAHIKTEAPEWLSLLGQEGAS